MNDIKKRRQEADKARNGGLISEQDHREIMRDLQGSCDHEWTERTGDFESYKICENCGLCKYPPKVSH